MYRDIQYRQTEVQLTDTLIDRQEDNNCELEGRKTSDNNSVKAQT